MQAKLLLAINKLFPEIPHPFNMRNNAQKSYAEWEFENGGATLEKYFFLDGIKGEYDIVTGKKILDIGAGAAGKSVYYLTRGARHVTALDILPDYKEEATAFAARHGVSGGFDYTVCNAAKMPFEAESFDAVIMNDSFEHVSEPEAVLREIHRVLVPHGKVYINFPPYNHPYGAHLTDTIKIPWVHLFFSEKTLILAYKQSLSKLPDCDARIKFRISRDESGCDYFSYINKMTLRRFDGLCKSSPLTVRGYKEIPLRNFLAPLAKMPLTREAFVRSAVCILEKPTNT